GRPSVTLPPTAAPSAPGVSALHASETAVFYEVITEVQDDAPALAQALTPQPRLGYILVRRSFSAAATSDILGRLLGGGAIVQFGNLAGDVWTDLAKAIPPPPVQLGHTGFQRYRLESG